MLSSFDLSELFRELLNRIQDLGKFDFLALVLHNPVDDVMRVNALHVLVPVTVPVSLQLPIRRGALCKPWQANSLAQTGLVVSIATIAV